MFKLYRAVVNLIESKSAAEQARAVAILAGAGFEISEDGDGELVAIESDAEVDSDDEPEGHAIGFTGKPKTKD